MNLRYLAIALAVGAEALLAVLFFALIPEDIIAGNVRWLDFIVASIVLGLWVFNILKPMVNLQDNSSRQVGGLGIRWFSVGWYSVLAMLLMVVNIFIVSDGGTAMSFGWQAFCQGILLFLLLCGLLASEFSIKKTADVYKSEDMLKSGKADIKTEVSRLVYAAEDNAGVPSEIKDRIRTISGETRFITPSVSPEALSADRTILEDCRTIVPALSDYEMNKALINARLSQLERDIQRRRSVL